MHQKRKASRPDSPNTAGRNGLPASESRLPVHFGEDFGGTNDGCGQEIRLRNVAAWGEEVWHVPAVHIFPEGLVLDLCVEVPAEPVAEFLKQWFGEKSGWQSLTWVQRTKLRAENPLNPDVFAELISPQETESLLADVSCGVPWVPGRRKLQEPEAKRVLRHYRLNPKVPWFLERLSFPWGDEGPVEVSSLELHLKRNPGQAFGQAFSLPEVGESVHLFHPGSGEEYLLTVRSRSTLETQMPDYEEADRCFREICQYTLFPEIPGFQLMDCEETKPDLDDAEIRDWQQEPVLHPDGTPAHLCLFTGSPREQKVRDLQVVPIFPKPQMHPLTLVLQPDEVE